LERLVNKQFCTFFNQIILTLKKVGYLNWFTSN
jgi:hypothetical protein